MTAGTAYDPAHDLALLLGAAQRQVLGYDASGGIRTFATRLIEGLRLPELATAAEIQAAICEALADVVVTALKETAIADWEAKDGTTVYEIHEDDMRAAVLRVLGRRGDTEAEDHGTRTDVTLTRKEGT